MSQRTIFECEGFAVYEMDGSVVFDLDESKVDLTAMAQKMAGEIDRLRTIEELSRDYFEIKNDHDSGTPFSPSLWESIEDKLFIVLGIERKERI